jgi:MFS family permease
MQKRASNFRRIPLGVWALGLVSLLMDVSSEIIHALLPAYLVAELGASMLSVGVVEGIAEATAAITKVFSGAFSDFLGRRKLPTVIGYGLSALSKPIFPLASAVSGVFAARFIDRMGVRDAPRDALLADIAPEELRGASFGLRQSLDTVGAFLGPLIGIVLMWLTADHYRTVFWFAVLPALMAVAVLVIAVREPPRPPDRHLVPALFGARDLRRFGRSYWWVTVVAVIYSLAHFSEAFLILKAKSASLPVTLLPLVLVIMNTVYAAAAYPAGLLSDRFGRLSLLSLGITVLIAADLMLAFAGSLTMVAIAVALWGLHLGLTQGILSALIADTAPAELRGTGFGLFNLLVGLALLASSVLAGALWDLAGARFMFLTGAVFALLTLAGLAATRRIAPALRQAETARPVR